MLKIKDLTVRIKNKKILKGINLNIKSGEIHAIMGPNGAGKTTIGMSIMGNPKFNPSTPSTTLGTGSLRTRVQSSKLSINNKRLKTLDIEDRARLGLFVSFQNPIEIPGVSVLSFLRAADNSINPNKNVPISEFKKKVIKLLLKVGLDEDFLARYVNEGFSGGEKKKFEVVQLLLFKPKIAILDEIDTGLDIDSLKKIAVIIKILRKRKTGILIISHNRKIFDYIRPDFVHVLKNGEIKKTGSVELIDEIEKSGYEAI